MSSAGKTWRQHPFVLGQRYLARTSFQGFPGLTFMEGYAYELLQVGYSRYDGCTVFTFRGDDQDRIEWFWGDDEPDALCTSRFCEAD